MQDFAEMADIEMLLIDENSRLPDFKKELRWNEIFYTLAKGV
jgi:L-arabinose isomerase